MVRRVLLQGIVNAIGMVVVHVFSDQPVKMPFVQRDDRVEQLAPGTADPALGDAVLPGAWMGDSTRFTIGQSVVLGRLADRCRDVRRARAGRWRAPSRPWRLGGRHRHARGRRRTTVDLGETARRRQPSVLSSFVLRASLTPIPHQRRHEASFGRGLVCQRLSAGSDVRRQALAVHAEAA
jgi:hypothetical protein